MWSIDRSTECSLIHPFVLSNTKKGFWQILFSTPFNIDGMIGQIRQSFYRSNHRLKIAIVLLERIDQRKKFVEFHKEIVEEENPLEMIRTVRQLNREGVKQINGKSIRHWLTNYFDWEKGKEKSIDIRHWTKSTAGETGKEQQHGRVFRWKE